MNEAINKIIDREADRLALDAYRSIDEDGFVTRARLTDEVCRELADRLKEALEELGEVAKEADVAASDPAPNTSEAASGADEQPDREEGPTASGAPSTNEIATPELDPEPEDTTPAANGANSNKVEHCGRPDVQSVRNRFMAALDDGINYESFHHESKLSLPTLRSFASGSNPHQATVNKVNDALLAFGL